MLNMTVEHVHVGTLQSMVSGKEAGPYVTVSIVYMFILYKIS